METEDGTGTDKGSTKNDTAPKPGPKKKKGTAATVKAPRGAKGGGPGSVKKSKASGGAKKKAAGSVAGSDAGTVPDLEADDSGAEDADEGTESDGGPYCICRGPDNHKFMIACDKCEDWFHGDCIGMDKYTGENLVQKYICPSCSDEAMGYVTRYKKMCALDRCERPARIYGDANEEEGGRSYFCSDEHCQTWWEHLIAKLPRGGKGSGDAADDALTQEQFMALLGASQPEGGWRLGEKPFAVPPNFWDTVDSKEALTEEESGILRTSAAERYSLGEEIVLCKKMLQLMDMAAARREAAVAAGKGSAKDLCGYDFRLDDVGVTAQFSRFIASPDGEAIFKAGKLDKPAHAPYSAEDGANPAPDGTIRGMPAAGFGCAEDGFDPVTAGMCTRKKCKPHHGWNNMLTKHIKHNMKELAREAKEKLDAEERIRGAATGRFVRKKYENNSVRVFHSDDEGDTTMADVS
ncbi:hypothetical protein GQ53DRAFT_785401 [Thozetella sp. PMI_491]|nr:hypothetical protein GQ53DRAFT_785401 [Thozetella sp. PMI_491]